jgi:hypothetical protein
MQGLSSCATCRISESNALVSFPLIWGQWGTLTDVHLNKNHANMTKAIKGAAEIGYHFHEGLTSRTSTFIPNKPYISSVESVRFSPHGLALLNTYSYKHQREKNKLRTLSV